MILKYENLKNKKVYTYIFFILPSLVLLSVIAYLVWSNYVNFRDTIINTEQQNLLTIADTTAKALETFMDEQRNNLEIISKNPTFQKKFKILANSEGTQSVREILDTYINTQQGSVVSVQLLDKEGVILETLPSNKEDTEHEKQNISYFQEVEYVIKEHKSTVGQVYFDKSGVSIICILEPIFYNGEFEGIIRSKVNIDFLYNKFVEPIRVGKKGYASVKDKEGILLMHPKAEDIGKNVIEARKEQFPNYDWSELQQIVEKQKEGDRGTSIYHSIWGRDKQFNRIKKFSAYSPAVIGDTFWVVTVSMDYFEIVDVIKNNLYNVLFLALVIIFIFVLVSLYIYKLKEAQNRLQVEAKYVREVEILNEELKKDIEERKLLEQELIKSKEKYKVIFNSGSDCVFVVNVDNDGKLGKFLEVNDKASGVLGYSKLELQEKNYYDIDSMFDNWEINNVTQKLSLDKAILYETTLRSKDKRNIPVEVHAQLFKLEDDLKIILVSRDITKRKMEEETLKRNEAIMIYQSRFAAMGEMIGNIAHQWRQPLSSLSLILTNIDDMYKFNDFDKAIFEDLNNKAKKLIHKMSQTIDDFRYFFNPRIEKQIFSTYENINTTLELCEDNLKFNKINLIIIKEDDPKGYGYPNQYSQVIFNIINNAVDALVECGRKDKNIEILICRKENMSCVEIKDNAGGIKEEIVSKIFEPYFTSKKNKNGTGLGLYMSKMIIEKNFKGKISFKNTFEGACFNICIPLKGEGQDA